MCSNTRISTRVPLLGVPATSVQTCTHTGLGLGGLGLGSLGGRCHATRYAHRSCGTSCGPCPCGPHLPIIGPVGHLLPGGTGSRTGASTRTRTSTRVGLNGFSQSVEIGCGHGQPCSCRDYNHNDNNNDPRGLNSGYYNSPAAYQGTPTNYACSSCSECTGPCHCAGPLGMAISACVLGASLARDAGRAISARKERKRAAKNARRVVKAERRERGALVREVGVREVGVGMGKGVAVGVGEVRERGMGEREKERGLLEKGVNREARNQDPEDQEDPQDQDDPEARLKDRYRRTFSAAGSGRTHSPPPAYSYHEV